MLLLKLVIVLGTLQGQHGLPLHSLHVSLDLDAREVLLRCGPRRLRYLILTLYSLLKEGKIAAIVTPATATFCGEIATTMHQLQVCQFAFAAGDT